MPDAKRTPPPPLEAQCPPCSICGETTEYDDGTFRCDDCGCWWNSKRGYWEDGEWNEPDAEQCPSTDQPWADDERPAVRDTVFRCILTAGHEDRRHVDPSWSLYREWDDAEAAEPAPSVVTVHLPVPAEEVAR